MNTDGLIFLFVPQTKTLSEERAERMFLLNSFSGDHNGSTNGPAGRCTSSGGTLLLVRPAVCSWRNATTHNSSQHDDRKQIRQPGEEIVVDAWVGLLNTCQEGTQVPCRWRETDRHAQCLGPHKEKRAAERSQWSPAPKDHGSQCNE